MICKNCGAFNEAITLVPVYPKTLPVPDAGSIPEKEKGAAYSRWACHSCGRYHFPDGSLYSNPFAKEQWLEAVASWEAAGKPRS